MQYYPRDTKSYKKIIQMWITWAVFNNMTNLDTPQPYEEVLIDVPHKLHLWKTTEGSIPRVDIRIPYVRRYCLLARMEKGFIGVLNAVYVKLPRIILD